MKTGARHCFCFRWILLCYSPAFAFEKWIIHIAYFLLHILQKGYAFAFEKVKKTLSSHITLYIHFFFQTTKTTIYIAKILSSKKSSFFNFFSFSEERHPVVHKDFPVTMLCSRSSLKLRIPCSRSSLKLRIFIPEERHIVFQRSGVVTA